MALYSPVSPRTSWTLQYWLYWFMQGWLHCCPLLRHWVLAQLLPSHTRFWNTPLVVISPLSPTLLRHSKSLCAWLSIVTCGISWLLLPASSSAFGDQYCTLLRASHRHPHAHLQCSFDYCIVNEMPLLVLGVLPGLPVDCSVLKPGIAHCGFAYEEKARQFSSSLIQFTTPM